LQGKTGNPEGEMNPNPAIGVLYHWLAVSLPAVSTFRIVA